MFEKSRASNITAQATHIPATITLTTGETLTGTLATSGVGRLAEILNSAAPFVEFRTLAGETRHFNKVAIISISPVEVPSADQLSRRNVDAAVFDPYAVLGITNAATPEQIHAAYVTMARNYHPDRYAASGLPREVTDYICAMAKRINAAWDILSSSHALA
jgi:hypothetical protein